MLYNNRFGEHGGWVRTSAAFAVKGGGDAKTLHQQSLGDALGLTAGPDRYCVFRDPVAGLDYIRGSSEIVERGLFAQLDAYRCQVFLDFREVRSEEAHPWAQLASELEGRGVPNIGDALEDLKLRPVGVPFRELVNPGAFRWLIEARRRVHAVTSAEPSSDEKGGDPKATGPAAPASRRAGATNGARGARREVDLDSWRTEVEDKFARLIAAVHRHTNAPPPAPVPVRDIGAKLEAMIRHEARDLDSDLGLATLLGWLFTHATGRAFGPDTEARSREWLRSWRWDRALAETFQALGDDSAQAYRRVDFIEGLIGHATAFRASGTIPIMKRIEAWQADSAVRRWLLVNQHEGVWWFHKESWIQWVNALAVLAELEITSDATLDEALRAKRVRETRELRDQLLVAADNSGYRLDALAAPIVRP